MLLSNTGRLSESLSIHRYWYFYLYRDWSWTLWKNDDSLIDALQSLMYKRYKRELTILNAFLLVLESHQRLRYFLKHLCNVCHLIWMEIKANQNQHIYFVFCVCFDLCMDLVIFTCGTFRQQFQNTECCGDRTTHCSEFFFCSEFANLAAQWLLPNVMQRHVAYYLEKLTLY